MAKVGVDDSGIEKYLNQESGKGPDLGTSTPLTKVSRTRNSGQRRLDIHPSDQRFDSFPSLNKPFPTS